MFDYKGANDNQRRLDFYWKCPQWGEWYNWSLCILARKESAIMTNPNKSDKKKVNKLPLTANALLASLLIVPSAAMVACADNNAVATTGGNNGAVTATQTGESPTGESVGTNPEEIIAVQNPETTGEQKPENYDFILGEANRRAQWYRDNGYEVTGVYVCTSQHPNGYLVWFIDPETGKKVAFTHDFTF